MDADSVVKAFSLSGKDAKTQANSLLHNLRSSGKNGLVSGWNFTPEATGKPMWQVYQSLIV